MNYEISEIGNGLYKISSRLGPRYVHQYLLVENENAILIDVGMNETPTEVLAPAFEEVGVSFNQLKAVVISHSDVDHFSGLASFKEMANHVPVIAHKLDSPWIESTEKILAERYFAYEPFGVAHDEDTKEWFKNSTNGSKVDLFVNGDEVFHLGGDRYIDILHTPGHSAGHLSLYDRRNRAAIVIDAILWKGLYDTKGEIISPPPYYSISSYLRSIEKVMALEIDVLLTGHFDVLTGDDVQKFLQESKAYVQFVGDTVEKIVTNSPEALALNDILHQTNQQVGNFTAMMVELAGPVYAHLVELEKEQKITRLTNRNVPVWVKK